jgi:hypothetical protein
MCIYIYIYNIYIYTPSWCLVGLFVCLNSDVFHFLVRFVVVLIAVVFKFLVRLFVVLTASVLQSHSNMCFTFCIHTRACVIHSAFTRKHVLYTLCPHSNMCCTFCIHAQTCVTYSNMCYTFCIHRQTRVIHSVFHKVPTRSARGSIA